MYPQPDERGRYGPYGGRYVPETLMPALDELQETYSRLRTDTSFQEEYRAWLRDYVGRPSLLTPARNLSREAGGARIWLQREDPNHSRAHKINHEIGQALIARRRGKQRIIAETRPAPRGGAAA